jgi:hypothetical protein
MGGLDWQTGLDAQGREIDDLLDQHGLVKSKTALGLLDANPNDAG